MTTWLILITINLLKLILPTTGQFWRTLTYYELHLRQTCFSSVSRSRVLFRIWILFLLAQLEEHSIILLNEYFLFPCLYFGLYLSQCKTNLSVIVRLTRRRWVGNNQWKAGQRLIKSKIGLIYEICKREDSPILKLSESQEQ